MNLHWARLIKADGKWKFASEQMQATPQNAPAPGHKIWRVGPFALWRFRRVAGLAGRQASDQEERLAKSEQAGNRVRALHDALTMLHRRERRIFEARRLTDDPITLEDLAA
jgi:hypothetical protein